MSYFIEYNIKTNQFVKTPITVQGYFQEHFQGTNQIAEGNYSHVFSVVENGSKFVVKRHKKRMLDDYDREVSYQEIKALTLVMHSKNCVRLFEAWEEEGVLYLKMELCGKNIEPIDLRKLFTGVLDGLENVHSKQFVHRDIKLDNILVGQDGNYKIIDFGIASESNERELYLQDLKQVALMMKEIIFGKEVDQDLLIEIDNILLKKI